MASIPDDSSKAQHLVLLHRDFLTIGANYFFFFIDAMTSSSKLSYPKSSMSSCYTASIFLISLSSSRIFAPIDFVFFKVERLCPYFMSSSSETLAEVYKMISGILNCVG